MTYVLPLPNEIGFVLLGTYAVDTPLSTGDREFAVSIVDDKVRLRIGETERLMIDERFSTETSNGVKSADVYGVTVVGMPGVQLQFKGLNNRVQYVAVFEDFAKPPVTTTGRPKRG